MRSREPSLHSAISVRLPADCKRFDVFGQRLEYVLAGFAPFRSEVVPGARADLDHIGGTFR